MCNHLFQYVDSTSTTLSSWYSSLFPNVWAALKDFTTTTTTTKKKKKHTAVGRKTSLFSVLMEAHRGEKSLTQKMEERSHFLLSITFLLVVQYSSLYMAELTIGTDATQTNITTDQSALLTLRSHITSDPHNILVNWSTTTSVCNWFGVTCGARHLRVASLNLSYMGFIGTIPPHLGNLSFLVALSFNNNSFHGTLPHELSYLRRLKFINFGYNNFMGSIPSWFGSFPKLQSFYLYGNQFSGFIPATIFNLSTLQIIYLNNNQLSGTYVSTSYLVSTIDRSVRFNILSLIYKIG